MTITEKSKILAEYLCWVYVPNNDLGEFPKAGWYTPLTSCKPSKHSSSNVKVGDMYTKYVCRSHNQLRFYNSFDELIPVLNKLTEEDLKEYMYSWEECTYEDKEGCELETCYNFEGIGWDVNRGYSQIYIHLALDPTIFIGECKGEGIVKNTFEACYQAINYINEIKERK